MPSRREDTRPPCRICEGRGKRRLRRGLLGRRRLVTCGFCSGSGREPRIVDSGPVHFDIPISAKVAERLTGDD